MIRPNIQTGAHDTSRCKMLSGQTVLGILTEMSLKLTGQDGLEYVRQFHVLSMISD